MARPEDIAATYADPETARAYDASRARSLHELVWLRRVVRGLAPGAPVLDLGCGAGEPIGAWLAGQGYDLSGVDASEAMLAIARGRMPAADWIEGDMRTLDLGRRFDAVIAWDSLFHLDPDGQAAALSRIAAHLNPGGRLLTTVGPRAGEAVGHVGEARPVYHASLSPARYAAALEELGLELTAFMAEDPECGGHSVVMAQRP